MERIGETTGRTDSGTGTEPGGEDAPGQVAQLPPEARDYYEQNREAVDRYNDLVEKRGLFGDGFRRQI